MHTSWSEIDTARHCLAKHHYRYKERWRDREESEALNIGNRWHLMMNELYATGEESAPGELILQWRDEGVDHEIVERLAWMLDGYYQRWGKGDPLWQHGAVMTEQRFEVELPDIGMGPLTLVLVVDLAVEVTKKLWVVDHKSSKYSVNGRDLELADQWTLYVWALRRLGYDVFGSVHNSAKTEKLKRAMSLEERYSRIPIHRTDRECEAVAREATITAWTAKSNNGAPRSPGELCFRRCGYLDACIADRRYGPTQAEHILNIRHYRKPEEQS